VTRFAALVLVGIAGFHLAEGASPLHFLWTAPLVILAAFLIAWGAEAAQFMISQGLALAILAWLQTLPEFAVEADIAWNAARDPTGEGNALMTANFTGSIRLLMGFGMPVVYLIHALSRRGKSRRSIDLDRFHSVEVVSLFPPVLYFFFIIYRGRLDVWLDSVVLLSFYLMYFWLLLKMPPEREGESSESLPPVTRAILRRGPAGRMAGIALVFLVGGAVLYACVHPFVESLKSLGALVGIGGYFFVQWIAPFLSEFPEKVSAFNWARREGKAKIGLMNFLSSNLNQMTMLVAMLPIVYSISSGGVRPVLFDEHQRSEILLTGCQAALCMVLLFNMKFEWWDAAGMFLLFVVQFLSPAWVELVKPVFPDLTTHGVRHAMVWVYLGWIVLEILLAMFSVRRWSFPLRLRRSHQPDRRA